MPGRAPAPVTDRWHDASFRGDDSSGLEPGPSQDYTHIVNLSSLDEAPLSLRARLRSATRDAILTAAGAAFAAERTAPVRMEDIAALAGVAVGTVYNYFEDRAALVNELLELRSRALLDALDEALATPPGPRTPSAVFAADLERFVDALARHFDANRTLMALLLDDEQAQGVRPRVATRRRTLFEQVLLRAERLMARGMRNHALIKADPSTCAALLVGMVRGSLMASLADQRRTASERAQDVVRVFLHGAAR